jgi:predicted porin
MKKSLVALAVAGVIAAPAAVADVTLYGTVAVDYTATDVGTGADTGGIATDDVIVGVKSSDTLDNGMTVSAEIRMDWDSGAKGANETTDIDRGYVAVEGGFGKVWAGTFGSPLNALDVVDFSDTLNLAAIGDEVDQGLAYTSPDFGGVDFYWVELRTSRLLKTLMDLTKASTLSFTD